MASISDINRLNINSLSNLIQTEKDVNFPGTGGFGELLDQAMGAVQQTDTADKISDVELLAGDVNDLHTAVLAGEKADLALRLTLQLRNKVVEAYNEIMRMQV